MNKSAIKINGLGILLSILFSFTFFNVFAAEKVTSQAEMTYIKIGVNGMACPFCAYGLEKKIKKLKGVKSLDIDINEGFITFGVPLTNKPSEQELQKIVKEAGFEIREIEYSSTPFELNKDDKKQ